MRIAASPLELNPALANDPAKIDKVARQLEGQFAQMLIKSMRAASFGDSLFPGENQMFREMYDQRIAEQMTRGRGLGLSSVIARQLGAADAAGNTPVDPALKPSDAARAYQLNAPPAAALPLHGSTPALDDPLAQLGASERAAYMTPQAQALDLIAGRDTSSLHAALGSNNPYESPGLADAPDWAVGNDRWNNVTASERSQSVDNAQANLAADQLGKHTPEGFVASIWPHAERAARELGVNPRALVAQAALETGWGKRHIKRDNGDSSHNLFGIKANGWSGERATTGTHEYVNGQRRNETASFRAYGSVAESFGDYVRMLKNSPRYQAALKAGSDVRGFAQGLQRAGYATDPSYAAKIAAIAAGPTIERAVAAIDDAGTRFGQTFASTTGLTGTTRR
ncbi:flagellar assembly peptidoglycan hydrolase FlgJ [Stenotrophomonas sp. SY1]|uniref:flagellar assembly peptidoglycan hydrolase FlgJ n=1 Tax=Stenotrophomonas sp. SY1 TaxID=477235 RepID=UPI001E4F7908|nr:flagellar assembly peptidoglycan hydrolase FlgJ [Stenotrophomonas sp. SY1]MCD9087141.1 flagellar assembly peptidoglycan hydrolase FlgJ [Stenotrophomonas sp. SY1]